MKASQIYIDQQLFALIAVGDENAFREIFATYNQQLFPYVMSLVKSDHDAREVMQEVFLKLWLQRDNLGSVTNPGGWLRTITAHVAFDYLRKQARYQNILAELSDDPLLNLDDAPETLHLEEFNELVNAAASLLPARRREIFRLAKLEGYSRREIAERLQLSENTVRNQLGEAMEFIQTYLQQQRNLSIPVAVLGCVIGQG